MPLSRKYYIKFADLFAEHNRGVSAEFRRDFENLLKTDNPDLIEKDLQTTSVKIHANKPSLLIIKARMVSTVRAFLRPAT